MAYAVAIVCLGFGTILMLDVVRSIYSGLVTVFDRASAFQSLASAEYRLAKQRSEYKLFVAAEQSLGGRLAAATQNPGSSRWEVSINSRIDGWKRWLFDQRSIEDACYHANWILERIEWTKREVVRLRGQTATTDHDIASWKPVAAYAVDFFVHLPFAFYMYWVGLRFCCRGLLVAGALKPISLGREVRP